MKKMSLLILFALFDFVGCADELTEEDLAKQEYIVKWYDDKDGNENE